MSDKIPHVIHQIWLGDKPQPTKWMCSWQNIPGWRYELWDEKKIDELNLINRQKYDYYLNRKIYHGAADVARIEILYQHGGVYIDADTLRLASWTHDFLDTPFFCVQGNTKPSDHYRITNGIIGSTASHPLLADYISEISQATRLEPAWDTIGGTMFTKIVSRYNVHILEPYWFYPRNSRGIFSDNHEKAIAQHFWGSTHRKETENYD